MGGMKKLDARSVRIGLALGVGLLVLVSLGLLAGIGTSGLSAVAQAYEYSTTITTSTSTSTSTSTTTTTTPTETRPGKGCGDKNHLHDRRFECKLTINDVSGKEGNSGTTAFTFTINVSGSPLSTITVAYSTAAGTATAGADFNAASGTLSFAPGVSTKTVTVSVIGDRVREPSNTFFLNLSNPSANAYLGDPQALATIVNDD